MVSCCTASDDANLQLQQQPHDGANDGDGDGDDGDVCDDAEPTLLAPYSSVGSATTTFVRHVGDDHSYHDCT